MTNPISGEPPVDVPKMLERAWDIITEAMGVDETEPPPSWHDAARRWRDEMYHPWLDGYAERQAERLRLQLERDRAVAQATHRRKVEQVELPASIITVPGPDGGQLITSVALEELRDQMMGHIVEATRPVRGGVAYRVGPDLRDASLGLEDVVELKEELEEEMERVAEQVARPRTNLGNSGPPGRID